jgi:hypothetical protein
MPSDDASAGDATRRNGAATRPRDDASMSRVLPSSVPRRTGPVELRLLVWIDPGSAWRARVSGPGMTEREFDSPFELARFVAWPRGPAPRGGPGLR